MNPRREIEFQWDGAAVRSRPTMAKVSEVERKFGAAPVLARRCAALELSVMGEQLPILAIMLRGCEGVPKKDAEIVEEAFDAGAIGFLLPMTEWLAAAYSVNEPPTKSAPEGN